jgi:hypothetical protein
MPPGCAGCATGFAALPAHYRATMPAGDRWALLMYTSDAVVSAYFTIDGDTLAGLTADIRDGMAPGTGQGAFVLAGSEHVMLANVAGATGDGVVLSDWIIAWAAGAAGWQSEGP